MITCEICGTQAEQHDHWRHLMVARVAALEDVVTREPATDGQLASAGDAPKRCPHGVPSHLGCWNCTSRYVKIGDVVMDEPPAEQPIGCPKCACCNDDACPVRHTNCETLCRDRAKAKAAEHVVEHMRPLMVSEAGRTLMAKAAEPSAPAAGTPGTGAPAPKCDPDPPREVAPDRTQAKPHDSNCRAVRTGRSDTCNCVGKDARIYPCKECGDMRSMPEGGTTFTVCDACWGKTYEGGQQ